MTRCIRLSSVSPAFSVASVTLAAIRCPAGGARAIGVLQRRGEAARHHMGAAQVGLREGDQDGAVVVAAGEVDIAHQPRHQPRARRAGALVERAVEGKRASDSARLRSLGFGDRFREIAPEGIAA